MYFRASQLPQLSSVSYSDRWRILISAARAYDRWIFLRMAVVFVLMVMTTTAVNFLPSSFGLRDWAGTAITFFYGVLFYALLLWEFNGPLGRAVVKHLSDRQSHAPSV